MSVGIIYKVVLQNPFRVLGVYTNSPKRDIIANKAKASAFLKVSRPVEFPLDLKDILSPLSRTLDLLNEAEAHLSVAKEQVKYSQYWFVKTSNPLDEIAFNHLYAGDVDKAIEIWSKKDTLSSLQNKIVCFLIKGNLDLVLKSAEELYEKYGDDFISSIDASCTLQMSSKELFHQFVDTLMEEVDVNNLFSIELREETKSYIKNKVVESLINKITIEVDKTKKIDHKDSIARIEAARKLVVNTKEPFMQLKKMLSLRESRFQMIADKLGSEILQCGIDYFNNSEDDDAPHTAMKMQKYALSVVVGSLARQRCEENIKILQKIIDELPPKEVISEDKAIKAELGNFVRLPNKIIYAIQLLNNTKKYLLSIKQKLGEANTYYLKLSTQIVGNALHNVVEEVNDVQNDLQIAFRLQLGVQLDPSSLEKIKSTVREAWKATTIMDGFDLEPAFKSHYNENRNTLKSMCNQMGIPTYANRTTPNSHPQSGPSKTNSPRPSTVYERVYNNASAGEAFWEHIKSPESSRWEAATIMTILGGLIGFLIYYNNPGTIAIDEKWSYIGWGTAIGAISWLCILYDNDERSFDARGFDRGGCVGGLMLIGLFIFYWIYKFVRLVIDGIKS